MFARKRPADPDAARRYDAAARTVEQAQQRLGLDRREPRREVSLPRRYERLLGEQRAERLLGTLREASAQVGSLDHEQLTSLAKAGRDAISQLDEQAAQQATRLEHEREQHHQAIGELAARRQSLTEQAGELGWRQRHEREHLRAAAASQEQYLARHQADIERADLALQRLASAGRHPDQWIERPGRQFVEGLAAEYALGRGHEPPGTRDRDRGHAREQQPDQLARDDERDLGLER